MAPGGVDRESRGDVDATATDWSRAVELQVRRRLRRLQVAVRAPRFRHVRHYLRSLSFLGLVFGWLFFLMSLTPSLLPRTWQAQGVVSGSAVAQGYGIGVVLAWAGRRLGVPRPTAARRRRAWQFLAAFALVTVPVALWLGSAWQNDIRKAVGAAPQSGRYVYLGVLAVAAGVAAGVVGTARLLHDGYHALAARLRRFVPHGVSRLIATMAIVALVVGLATGFAQQVFLRAANSLSSAASHGNERGVVRPGSALRSGSDASLVSWDSLGKKGREFVATGPTVIEIARFTGRPAVEPIRVYAGLASAKTLRDEARLVLAELERTGAFDRAVLAVAVTTASGWVDAKLVNPLEYMYGGDTAVAAMQYSYLPSWISFVSERQRAQEAGRELFNTVYARWSTLPATHRPRLVIMGKSMGAYGAEAAFSGVDDITARTDGALFAGPPNSSGLWRELVDRRVHGSPEWRPISGDGRTVRFAASATDLHDADGTLSHPRIVYLQNPNDPIVWWSPSLAWKRPDWLEEPRGPGVADQMRWYPLVTFWQVTGDLIAGNAIPPGQGHQYGPEIPTAWAAILHPAHWTDAETARLTAHLAATYAREGPRTVH